MQKHAGTVHTSNGISDFIGFHRRICVACFPARAILSIRFPLAAQSSASHSRNRRAPCGRRRGAGRVGFVADPTSKSQSLESPGVTPPNTRRFDHLKHVPNTTCIAYLLTLEWLKRDHCIVIGGFSHGCHTWSAWVISTLMFTATFLMSAHCFALPS